MKNGLGFQKVFEGSEAIFHLIEVFVVIEYLLSGHLLDVGGYGQKAIILSASLIRASSFCH
jgi:hypothetical protein